MTPRKIPMSDVSPGNIIQMVRRHWRCTSIHAKNGPIWVECDKDGNMIETKDPPRWWCATEVTLINKAKR